MPNKYVKWTEEEIVKLKEFCELGYSVTRISEILKKTTKSVAYAKWRHGYKRANTTNKESDEKLKRLNESELAYIAGIIDGEGSIQIYKRTTTLQKGEINPIFRFEVKITNTSYKLISWLKEKIGGYIGYRKSSGNRRTQFSIVLTQKTTYNLLKKIYNYLVIKQKQANIVFEMRETYNDFYGITPLEIVEKRTRCYLELKKLHWVGYDTNGQVIENAT